MLCLRCIQLVLWPSKNLAQLVAIYYTYVQYFYAGILQPFFQQEMAPRAPWQTPSRPFRTVIAMAPQHRAGDLPVLSGLGQVNRLGPTRFQNERPAGRYRI